MACGSFFAPPTPHLAGWVGGERGGGSVWYALRCCLAVRCRVFPVLCLLFFPHHLVPLAVKINADMPHVDSTGCCKPEEVFRIPETCDFAGPTFEWNFQWGNDSCLQGATEPPAVRKGGGGTLW